jgi:catechol 2,3-dioxygenase-like lactoylglutathione lyase family enzyme
VPLYYTGLRVRNLERSIQFYTRALGLKVENRGDGREWGAGLWVELTDPRSKGRIELNWYPKGSKWATPFEPGDALDHLGFFLGHVPRTHLDRLYRRLIANGAKPTRITPDFSEGWTAYVTDPDGNWVEIFRRPTAAEQRAQAREAAAAKRKKKGTRRRKPSA